MLEKMQELYNMVSGREDLILTPKTKIADLKLSSLGLIHLVCQIEDAFDIEISNIEITRFKTVNDVLRCVKRYTKK